MIVCRLISVTGIRFMVPQWGFAARLSSWTIVSLKGSVIAVGQECFASGPKRCIPL